MTRLERVRRFFWRESPWGRAANAREAMCDRAAEHAARACPICNGTAVYLCPICRAPITTHSHENDYLCDTHGFVNPIRQSD